MFSISEEEAAHVLFVSIECDEGSLHVSSSAVHGQIVFSLAVNLLTGLLQSCTVTKVM